MITLITDYTHTHMRACMHACTRIHTHMHAHTHTHACTYTLFLQRTDPGNSAPQHDRCQKLDGDLAGMIFRISYMLFRISCLGFSTVCQSYSNGKFPELNSLFNQILLVWSSLSPSPSLSHLFFFKGKRRDDACYNIAKLSVSLSVTFCAVFFKWNCYVHNHLVVYIICCIDIHM